MKVSIILPTYNEVENVKVLIPKIMGLMKKQDYDFEVVVVDDSSPDGTAHEVRALMKKYGNLGLLLRPCKDGLGSAVRSGYDYCSGDVLCSMDCDGSFNYRDIPGLCGEVLSGRLDFVQGSRHVEGGGYEKKEFLTRVKGFVSLLGNSYVRVLFGLPLHDVSGNFRALSRRAWDSVKAVEKGNSFFLETALLVHLAGFGLGEVPVRFVERKLGVSKLNMKWEVPSFLFNTVKFFLKYNVLRKLQKRVKYLEKKLNKSGKG